LKRENRKLNLEIGKIKAKESIWEYSKTYSDNEIKRLTEELDSCRSDYEKLEANFYHLLELLPGEGSEQDQSNISSSSTPREESDNWETSSSSCVDSSILG